jgi:hypothetical protein
LLLPELETLAPRLSEPSPCIVYINKLGLYPLRREVAKVEGMSRFEWCISLAFRSAESNIYNVRGQTSTPATAW